MIPWLVNFCSHGTKMRRLSCNEKQRVEGDLTKDKRYCKLSAVEDLRRGDRTSLSDLPNHTAADYFVNRKP